MVCAGGLVGVGGMVGDGTTSVGETGSLAGTGAVSGEGVVGRLKRKGATSLADSSLMVASLRSMGATASMLKNKKRRAG